MGRKPAGKSGPALKDEGGIYAAKGEVVADDVLGLERADTPRDVVEPGAGGVHLIQVEGGGEPALPHHLDAEPGFQGTAGAQGVAEVPLEGADGDPLAEHLLGGDGLRHVTAVGGGAVGI